MSDAVTIKDIDAALAARYAGMSIWVGDPAVLTPVTVFIEEPAPEEYPERVFPSVTLKLMSILPDFARWHSDDDEHAEEELSYDDMPAVPLREMRQVPVPSRLIYSFDTWHRVRAGEGRDLLQEAVFGRTHPRGSMSVGAVKVWVLWSGGLANLDEVETDEVILHKSLTIEVLADVLPTAVTVQRPVVTRVLWDAYRLETKLASPTETVLTGEKFLDLRFEVTEIGEGLVP